MISSRPQSKSSSQSKSDSQTKSSPQPQQAQQNLFMFTPIETVKGVGPKTAALLRQIGLSTIGDLFYTLPKVYENYQTATSISALRPGKVIVRGKISDLKSHRTTRGRLTITEGVIRDQTGAIRTVWFNQAYRAKQFDSQREYYFTGNYEFKNGRYALMTPSAVLAQDVENNGTAGFQATYAARGGLKPQTFRRLFQNLRAEFAKIPDLLPFSQLAPAYVKPGARATALFQAHFPENDHDGIAARQYLGYEELFEFLLAAKLNKRANSKLKALPLAFDAAATKAIVSSLPFALTGAQRRATWEILQNLGQNTPMNRLLQGDVGSGKTVVAALAAAQATAHGGQVALLAPTAILASQHYESLSQLFAQIAKQHPEVKLPKVALLIGATKGKAKLKAQIQSGAVDFVIGTHALLTDDTHFQQLALCIIDEQHRFGVNQRQKLLMKSPAGIAPHLLSMTATPIPRSLQLTVFGDLDVSLLNELPAGRQPITTKILPEIAQTETLYPAMRQLLEQGQQIYWICPAIDEVDTAAGATRDAAAGNAWDAAARKTTSSAAAGNAAAGAAPALAAAKSQAKKLQKLFPKYQVGLLHGKQKPDEKDQIMSDFANNRLQILVSTTVVEVGVNVPNANMMVVQNAEHYGLAQLHQLRGRVGRGNQPASCFLLTTGDERPSRRLREMEKSTDGFYLAEVDLKLRGPGEIYGSLQHGELNWQFANLGDTRTITAASRQAEEFVNAGANLANHPELEQRIHRYQQLTTLN